MATISRVELVSYVILVRFSSEDDVLVRHRTAEFVYL